MRRKDLEITLSVNVKEFEKPKIELEQYQTPARVAANLIHRASQLGDIYSKNVIDLCAGTGVLGIAASLMNANVTCLDIDIDSINILKQNCKRLEIEIETINKDVFEWETDVKYDTAIINPPFGIQQRKNKDMKFISKASKISDVIYSIHDGSDTNKQQLPLLFKKIGLEITEIYTDEFPLKKSYYWHKLNIKIHNVLVIRSKSFID